MNKVAGEIMTAEEIYARFESEWVVVNNPEVDANQVVQRGEVLWHGKDRGELHSVAMALEPPVNVAILYTGAITEEEALAYQLSMIELKYSLHGSPT